MARRQARLLPSGGRAGAGATPARLGGAAATVLALTVLVGHAATARAQAPAPIAPTLGPLGVHVVHAGETLRAVAARYGMRPSDLAHLNGSEPQAVLLPGRGLWVPLERAVNARAGVAAATGSAPVASPPAAASIDATPPVAVATATSDLAAASDTYTVAPGDTLFGLSRRFGVDLETLKRWNGLPADGSLRAGETLVVRGGRDVAPPDAARPAGATHDAYTVQAGDTLLSLAARFGTTVAALQRANGLAGEVIQIGQTLVVPRAGSGPPAGGGAKRIDVDVGEQHMYVWQGEQLVWSWVASTGMAGFPTRRGTFAVQSKIANAWSSPYQLWMPHWLGIYWAGGSENGIHALPIINGQRLWAGMLGTPISYGCVVLGVAEAELLFNWAEIGTPVVIRD